MGKKLTAFNAARRGFSLIELLVVLVILALLVGLVAPRFIGQLGKGQVAAAETQIGHFKTAIQTYMLDNNNQPPQSLDDLVTPPNGKKSYLGDVTSVPLDPWGNPYEYTVPGPGDFDYEVRSLGKDGKSLPNLPPSMVHILGNSRRTGAQMINGALVARQATPWVVLGADSVRFQVAKNKRVTEVQ